MTRRVAHRRGRSPRRHPRAGAIAGRRRDAGANLGTGYLPLATLPRFAAARPTLERIDPFGPSSGQGRVRAPVAANDPEVGYNLNPHLRAPISCESRSMVRETVAIHVNLRAMRRCVTAMLSTASAIAISSCSSRHGADNPLLCAALPSLLP